MTRYVVIVKPPDDHPGAVRAAGVFGTFVKAEAFCQHVRDEVDAKADMLDETTGYAYVIEIERPLKRWAFKWVLRGER